MANTRVYIVPSGNTQRSAYPAGNWVALIAPSGLSASASGPAVDLAWTNTSGGSVGARIYMTSNGVDFSPIADIAAGVSSYRTANLLNGEYGFKLKALSAAGEESASFSATASASVVLGGYGGAAQSGGTSALAWTAPDGLENGRTITITSSTQSFAQPSSQIFLGFGMGWLYDQADNTDFPSSVAVNGENWLHEGKNGGTFYGRRVQTSTGFKVLRSILKPGGAAWPYGAGCLNWDSGDVLTPVDSLYLFRRTRCTVGVKPQEFQWKQIRIRPGRDLEDASDPAANEAYCPRGNIGQSWQRVDVTPGTGQDVGYGTRLPTDGGEWCSFGWVWRPNTPDVADGVMYTHLVDPNRSGFARQEPRNSSNQYPRNVIRSTSPARPRWGMAQDFVQVGAGTADIVIESTDYYFKRNGDLFILADSADLSAVTENPVPLVPVSFNGASSWTFNLWRGDMTTFAGKYIHRLSALLEPLQVVAL